MKAPSIVALMVGVATASACSQALTARMDTRFLAKKVAGIVGQSKDDSRLLVAVVREDALPAFHVQKLPSTYSGAEIVLSNANSLLTSSLSKTLTIASGTTQAIGVYSALRPGNGYALACSLKNGAAVVGSGRADSITLAAGVNTVTIIIGVNGDIKVATSDTHNAVGDSGEWVVVKGDSITFNTGFDADEHTKATAPAGLEMQVILGNAIYDPTGPAGANRIVAEKTSGFDQYRFETGTSVAAASVPGYDKDKLVAAGNSSVTFRLLSGTAVVGESTLSPVRVIDPASLNLQLQ